jgi:hypothetical protein
MADLPSHRYYLANEARWRAPLEFTIRDWRAWRRDRLGFVARVGSLMMFVLTRLRLLRMETSVDCAQLERGLVVHRTWIRMGILTVTSSIERFELAADGLNGAISGEQRHAPLSFIAWPYSRSWLRVEGDGLRARYHMEAAGLAWDQDVRIEENATVVVMSNAWLHGEQRLVRTT